MPKEINLTGIGGWVRLEKNGATIRVNDPGAPRGSGTLRVGRRIHWKPAVRGQQREWSKSWEDLVNFLMS